MNENEISYQIRNAIYEVYEELGPGLLESSYEFALKHELEMAGLQVESQVDLSLKYKNSIIHNAYKLDLLVVIIELKSVDAIHKVHHKQFLI